MISWTRAARAGAPALRLLVVLAGLRSVDGEGTAAAAEDATDTERREADCIDLSNDLQFPDPERISFPANPWRFRVLAMPGYALASGDDGIVHPGAFIGVGLETETPVFLSELFLSSGSVTGLSVGISAANLWFHDDSTEVRAELRLGIKRRRTQPTWSTWFQRCMRERTEIGLDLMSWRAGCLNDAAAPDRPCAFVSTLGISALLRRSNPVAGWAASFTPEVGVAPTFTLGVRADLEFDLWRWLFARGEVQAHVRPIDGDRFVELQLAVGFDLGALL
jgi:hypothetical protein